ncbi:hypothetical protein [Lusitaniella coriacea]|nr:hypothetical protein [Lusitaniella coriacea]
MRIKLSKTIVLALTGAVLTMDMANAQTILACGGSLLSIGDT